MEDTFDTGDLFQEPSTFRPASPPPFNPKLQTHTLKSGRQVQLQLVSASPLWGHVLYPSSVCLARFLEDFPELVKGRHVRVLEMGAGAGLPGLVSGCLGASKVVTTDFPDANLIKNLECNIELNKLQDNCAAEGFVWGTPTDSLTSHLPSSSSGRFDILLLADLVFNHSQHIALLRSCEALLKVHERPASDSVDAPVALCFYAHHRPTPELIAKDEGFLETASRRGWEVRLIVQDHEAGLAFPEDGGDPAIRRMVKGWTMKWTGKAVVEENDG